MLGLANGGKAELVGRSEGRGGRSREQISAGLPGWFDFIRKVTKS